MTDRYNLNNTYCKIYYKSTPEFERIRELCLLENNWLRNNYTIENLIIEEHQGFGVIFQTSTNKPIMMGGVFNDKRYPSNIAKMINRFYVFPEFRANKKNMADGFLIMSKLIDELIKLNNFDCYLITMQNRLHRPSKMWWKTFSDHIKLANNNLWITGNGYIQTCPHDVQKCWQNFVYRNIKEKAFELWNPKLINHQLWMSLPEGN